MMQISTIYGEISTPDWEDDLIVRTLRTLGEWSYTEQLLAAQLVRRGDALWDGGAFVGTFGIGVTQIAAAQGRAPQSLLAIEPGAELRAPLLANLGRVRACKASLEPVAIGPANGRLRALAADQASENHGGIAYAEDDGAGEDAGAVPSAALWQVRQRHGAYDVLKIDLEGGENRALRDEFDYLAAAHPVIWAECNEALESIALLEAMVSAGYEPLYLAFPAFRKDNFRGTTDIPYPMAHEAVLLAAPPERLAAFRPGAVGAEVICRPVKTSWDLRQALWATPRWARPEWEDLSRAELVALLGRVTRGEDLRLFLNDRLEGSEG